MTRLSLTVLAALLAVTACSRKPTAPPPLEGAFTLNQTAEKPWKAELKERDGRTWALQLAPDSPFQLFADREVSMTLERRAKDDLLWPVSMKVKSPQPSDQLEEAGPEERFEGKFEQRTFAPDTKLAGESAVFFVTANNEAFLIANGIEKPTLDRPVRVRGHRVEPSRYVTQVGGPSLWITHVEPK